MALFFMSTLIPSTLRRLTTMWRIMGAWRLSGITSGPGSFLSKAAASRIARSPGLAVSGCLPLRVCVRRGERQGPGLTQGQQMRVMMRASKSLKVASPKPGRTVRRSQAEKVTQARPPLPPPPPDHHRPGASSSMMTSPMRLSGSLIPMNH